LTVDNGSAIAQAGSTPIRAVGKHVITGVTSLGGGLWNVAIAPESQIHQQYQDTYAASHDGTYVDAAGAVKAYHFTVTTAREVNISLLGANPSAAILLFNDTTPLGPGDIAQNYGGHIDQVLQPGKYVVLVGNGNLNATTAADAYNGLPYTHYSEDGGSFTLRIDTIKGDWLASDPTYNWGLDGMGVVLDDSDPNAKVYTIQSNDDESLFIQTNDDLSGFVGRELQGVKTLHTLTVTNGAKVDFGADRLIIQDKTDSKVDSTSTVTAGSGSNFP
jgi:hypothetical protein